MTTPGGVTQVLAELAAGNSDAAVKLLPLVYDELRTLADRYLRDEPRDHTLQGTALVHEVYIRMVGRNERSCESRAHFFAVAASAMRRILVDHARRRRAAKRGGDRHKFSLEQVLEPSDYRYEYLVALDDALTDLASIDEQPARVVELRFFGGLSVDETAEVLGVAPITVKRMWKLARGWLHREITKGD
ncbi:MAG: sigma-70 family RNA polymerase sigma factor [Gemmatimonadetes bacterium]|nr:sigma-70 family RNA polymerase sigma factor [Gemmatimonadota bacterium]